MERNVYLDHAATTYVKKEVLDHSTVSTIIELNKIAGESIDVLVNGKYVAKGEVVVLEENFGVRITEIIKEQPK